MDLFLAFIIVCGLTLVGFAGGLQYAHRNDKAETDIPTIGKFVINHDDPKTDLCTLALECDLPEIEDNKVMLIEIEVIGSGESESYTK